MTRSGWVDDYKGKSFSRKSGNCLLLVDEYFPVIWWWQISETTDNGTIRYHGGDCKTAHQAKLAATKQLGKIQGQNL